VEYVIKYLFLEEKYMEELARSCKLVEAEEQHLPDVYQMYKRCRDHLLAQGIFQWDDTYPNKEYFKEVIDQQGMYLLFEDDRLTGSMVLNEWESEEWSIIPWTHCRPWILHSLFLDPLQQRKGAGTKMLKHAGNLARERGYDSIRLDAFSGNSRSLRFYKRNGYLKRGEVSFSSKPEGHTIYFCYEKKL
jgi:GNAT superfamily N-acetyltransferase